MSLIACPECRRQVSTLAKACPQCGCPVGAVDARPLVVERPQHSVPPLPRAATTPLQEIAYRQKLMLYALLMNVLSQYPIWYFLQLTGFEAIGWSLVLANAVFSIWCLYRLGRVVRMPLPMILLFAFGLFIPVISLGVFIVAVGRATKELRSRGVPVGVMGANLSKVP